MKAVAAAAAALSMVALGVGNGAAADQRAASGSGGGSILPGQWEMTTRVELVEMPGATPQQQEAIRSQLGRADARRTCIAAEEAADPLREFRRTASNLPGQTCQITEEVFTGGAIRFAMACRGSGEAPASTQVSMTGTYAATAIDAGLSITVANPAPSPAAQAQSIRMRSSITGRRLGDCPPPAAAPVPAN